MSLRKYFSLVALAPILCVATPNTGLLRLPGDWIPYVERIQTDEIVLLEKQLPKSLSESSDLVVYNCDEEGKIHLALSLRSVESGYRLEMDVFDENTGVSTRRAIQLPRDVAYRLLDGFELILTKQVYPIAAAEDSHALRKGETSTIWIHLRVSGNKTALGKVLVPVGRCWVGIPDSNRPFFDILYRMRCCMDPSAYDGGTPITDLDFAISNLRLSYPK